MPTHRIAIGPERFAELSYLAAKWNVSRTDLVEHWIMDQWSHRDEKPIIPPDEEHVCRAEKHSEKRGHKDNKRLEEYPDLCGTVDKLLAQVPRPTYAEIGRAVNRSRTTISDYEKRKAKSETYISK